MAPSRMHFPKLRSGWKRPALRVLSSPGLWIVPALALALLAALLLSQPYYFTFDDNATGYLPSHIYNYRCVVEYATLPLINFHQFLGEVYYVMGTPGVLYLPSYLCTFFADKILGDIMTCMQVSLSLHLFLAALAAYAYLRVVKVSGPVSCYGALLYLTLPFLLCASKSWLVIAVCAFYIPALLACLEAFLRTRSSLYLVAQCVLKIAFIYHGNIQFVMIYGLGELLYLGNRWFYLTPRLNRSQILSYLLSNLVVIAASLPLIIPMQAALSTSAGRATAMHWTVQLAVSVQPKLWLYAQAYLFSPESICDSSSSLLHLGGSLIFLILFYALRSKIDRRWQTIWYLLLTALLLSTAANYILRVLPYFDRIRWPFKWYLFVVFAYAVMTALVLDELTRRRILSHLWLHVFFIVAITSNLIVTFSPLSQIPFGPYHLIPGGMSQKMTKLDSGRIFVFGPRNIYTYTSLPEIRGFNFATLYQEQAFGGYNPLLSSKVRDATFDVNYTGVFYDLIMPPAMRDALNQWSVRHIITAAESDNPFVQLLDAQPGLIFRGTTPSGFRLYENLQSRPYAWARNAPSRSLPMHFAVNSATIDLNGSSGDIIISIIRLPGWSYRIDAGPWKPVAHETSYGQITVTIPSGAQQLTLRYLPPRLVGSLYASALGLLLLLPAWYGISLTNTAPSFPTKEKHSSQKIHRPSFALPWWPNVLAVALILFWIIWMACYVAHMDMSAAAIGTQPLAPMDMFWRIK